MNYRLKRWTNVLGQQIIDVVFLDPNSGQSFSGGRIHAVPAPGTGTGRFQFINDEYELEFDSEAEAIRAAVSEGNLDELVKVLESDQYACWCGNAFVEGRYEWLDGEEIICWASLPDCVNMEDLAEYRGMIAERRAQRRLLFAQEVP